MLVHLVAAKQALTLDEQERGSAALLAAKQGATLAAAGAWGSRVQERDKKQAGEWSARGWRTARKARCPL